MTLLPHVALFFIPFLAILLVYPLLLKRSLRAIPVVEPSLRRQLDQLAANRNLSIDDFVIWNTRGKLANAMLVGAIPWRRFIVLTDELLRRLDGPGVMAMVGHELAHVRRGHPLARVVLVALPLWSWLWIQPTVPEFGTAVIDFLRSRMPTDARPELLVFFLVPMALALGLHLALGLFSRLLEHDADLCACGFYEPTTTDEQRQREVAELRAALGKLVPRDQIDRQTWLHPSPRARIELLRDALGHTEAALRVRRTVARTTRTMAFVFAAVPLLALLVHATSGT